MRTPRNRRRSMPPLAVAMTPMIDVVFLLLVYFLCTASFRRPEAELAASLLVETPPEVEAAVAVGEGDDPLQLDDVLVAGRIAGGGVTWTVNDGPRARNVAELATLFAELAGVSVALSVTLEPGPAVPLGQLVAAYDAARVAGFGEVRIVASEGSLAARGEGP